MSASHPGLEALADVLPTTAERVRRELDATRTLGLQLHVDVRGEVVVDAAVGYRDLHRAPLTSADRVRWMCAGKPVVAWTALELVVAGLVSLDEPLATYLPSFAVRGKAPVTLRHVLTHTGGFLFMDPALDWASHTFDEMMSAALAAPQLPDWQVGEHAAYNQFTAWWVLAALVESICGPSTFEHRLAAVLAHAGATSTRFGDAGDDVVEPHVLVAGRLNRGAISDAERAGRKHPSIGLVGPIGDLAAFLRMVQRCRQGDGCAMTRAIALEATTEQRRAIDLGLASEAGFGLGFQTNFDGRGVRVKAPRDSYGHVGFGGCWSIVYPDADVVVTFFVVGVSNSVMGNGLGSRLTSPLPALVLADLEREHGLHCR